MTNERFKELSEKNSDRPIQLCYEYFCEEKQPISPQEFNMMFPAWVQFFGGVRLNSGVDTIVKFLKNKHKL